MKTKKPLAHIIGEWEFCDLSFKVNEHTLIPRPETEELIHLIVKENKSQNNLSILDVGTGSGCIAISLKSFLDNSSVTAYDVSEEALLKAEENAALNNVEDKVNSIEGDVIEVCRQLIEDGEEFDVVIVDPPAFIPRRKDQKVGERAYQKLNQLAMRLLTRDGLLVSASCSMHLSRPALVTALRLSGQTLEKRLQIIEQGAQGADHPIVPAIPETEYLKAMFVRVLPA